MQHRQYSLLSLCIGVIYFVEFVCLRFDFCEQEQAMKNKNGNKARNRDLNQCKNGLHRTKSMIVTSLLFDRCLVLVV